MSCRFLSSVRSACIAVAFLAVMAVHGEICAQTPEKRILILNSYHEGYQWTDELVDAIRTRIRSEYPATEFYIENLDAKRFDSDAFNAEQCAFIHAKYAAVALDGIITSDDQAFQLVLQCHQDLFAGVPVAFCGVADFDPATIAGHPEITGMIQLQENLRPTVDLALELHPGTKRIAVIIDGTPESDGLYRDVQALQPLYPDIAFEFLSGSTYSFEELLDKLETLSSDTIGLLLLWQRDHEGHYTSVEEGTRLVTAHAPVPVYSLEEHRLGYGIVGGMLNSGTIQGRAVADIMLRVIGGESPARIPVHTKRIDFYSFDDAQLIRWHIDRSQLPENSYVINEPFSFYRTYRTLVLGVTGMFAVLSLLIVSLAITIRQRRLAEQMAVNQKELLTNVISHIPHLVYWKNCDLKYLGCNEYYARSAGFASPGDITGLTDADIPWKCAHSVRLETLERRVIDGAMARCDVIEKDLMPNGTPAQLMTNIVPISDVSGKVLGVLGIYFDITEQKRLEEQIVQAQKMESVGRLAGGIAHDFNNLLTIVIGNAEIALMDMDATEPYYTEIIEIKKTAERAAALTKQLLGFSRRQIARPQVVDINAMLLNLEKMFRRLIGADIELVVMPHEKLHSVSIDPGQLEQVLTNLLINSRDAMPDGGKITVETADTVLDGEFVQLHAETTPGEYVMISVSDTGMGMDHETVTHIFEPFFTTKEKGRGTGLGLSICYGIVKQNGGSIWVYSEPGAGTTIRIYLPAVTGSTHEEHETVPDGPDAGGTETIIVVEDEPSLNNMVTRILNEKGYRVLGALNGDEALALIETLNDEAIHLVITDVVMPRIGGRELADRIQRIRPEVRILFMSGYTDQAIVHNGILDRGVEFLQKPFRSSELLRKVRRILDE